MNKIFYIYFMLLVFILCIYVNKPESKVLITNKTNIIPVYKEYDKDNFSLEELRSKYNNNDIIGKIKINDKLDSLVVKYTDNSYYLNHDYYKNYNIFGSVFMDYRTNILDKKIIIYGHNFKYKNQEFSILENYSDYNYYLENQDIELIIDNYLIKYKIFSYYLTNYDYEYFEVNINNYNNHFNNLKNNSLYDTNILVNETNNILILQTCSTIYDDYYVILCAKEIERNKI